MRRQTEGMPTQPAQPAARPDRPDKPDRLDRLAAETRGATPGRRQVLGFAAALGAAGLVAACGGATGGSSGGSGGSGGANGSSSGGSSGVLAKTSDVPVGGGMILDNPQVVLTQPTAGTFKGFSSICTHMGCPLASVQGGTINCNCHGSQFSISDGSVKTGPATTPLQPVGVKVKGDSIVEA